MEYSDFGATRQEGRTASGIRVIVYTIPQRPIAMTATFNAGRRYGPPGLECLAHVAEHMLLAGTEDLPTKDRVAAYIEQLGGSIAASTAMSLLLLKLTIGNVSEFGAAVYLLNQALVHSRYDETTLNKELESVRQELSALMADPSRYAPRLLREQLLSKTTLGGRITDTNVAIDRVNISHVRSFVRQFLMGNNLAIVIAGGITLEEALIHLDQGLKLDLGGTMPVPAPVVHQLPTERLVTKVYASSKQVQLAYGFRGYPVDHHDSAALEVLTTIIGGGRASSLSRILRYDAGLIYSVKANSLNEIGFGIWRVTTGTNPDNLRTVIKLINNELDRAFDAEITQTELTAAKTKLVNSAPVRFDELINFLAPHVGPDLYDLPAFTKVPGHLNAIADVELGDVTRVARDIFRPGTSVLSLCGALPGDLDESMLY